MTVHVAFETPQDVHEIVYEMVKALGKDGRGSLKKGANEVTKAAERGTAMMVVMAEDVNPSELLAHVPIFAKRNLYPSCTCQIRVIWRRQLACLKEPKPLLWQSLM